MPRKKVATVERVEPAIHALDAAMGRLPASVWWSTSLSLMRSALHAEPQEVEGMLDLVGFAITRTAMWACADPTLEAYFRGPDRVRLVQERLSTMAAVACGVPPEKAEYWPILVWTPRGPRPGTRGAFTDVDDFVQHRRAVIRDLGPHASEREICEHLGVERQTYYRWLRRARRQGRITDTDRRA